MWRLVNLLSCLNAVSSKDLLFITENAILELPSFAKSSCSVELSTFQPISEYRGAHSGLVNNNLVVCDLRGCEYLCAGKWRPFPNMTSLRTGGASSGSSSGWFVTGGYNDAKVLNTTEVYTSENGWQVGPDLPTTLYGHCQLTVGETVYIIGIYYTLIMRL